jgi:hypothetical protein
VSSASISVDEASLPTQLLLPYELYLSNRTLR